MSFFNELPYMSIPEHAFNNGRSSDLFQSLITFPPTYICKNIYPGGKWSQVFKDYDPHSMVDRKLQQRVLFRSFT